MEQLQFTLKSCRVNANLKLKEVACMLDVDEKTVRNWEKGITVPNALELRKLSRIYCVPEMLIFLGNSSTVSRHYSNIKNKKVLFPEINAKKVKI